jgi:hypothetical protein
MILIILATKVIIKANRGRTPPDPGSSGPGTMMNWLVGDHSAE